MITREINSLGDGSAPLSADQVQQKWSDLKCQSKNAKMKYDKAANKTGGGQNTAKAPTEVQVKVNAIVGKSATEPIPGTQSLDTSARAQQRQSSELVVVRPTNDVSQEMVTEHHDNNSTNAESPSPYRTPSSKRARFCPKKQQLEQNEELLRAENRIVEEIRELKAEFQTLNQVMYGILEELRKGNNMRSEQQNRRNAPVMQLHYNDE